MKALINDANILIDLAKLDLMNSFSDLGFDLYSTDFVLAELNKDQYNKVAPLISGNELKVLQTEDEFDFYEIFKLYQNNRGLSFEDCSVWFYAKNMNGILLTGDKKLRKCASIDKVEVRGILYIFDPLVNKKILSPKFASQKIKMLWKINDRLPKNEINIRIEKWKNSSP